MKIIIVGGGLAGLTTYLHLQKRLAPLLPPGSLHITILERSLASPSDPSCDSASTFAGGYGIAPNGLRVLAKLNTELYRSIISQGYMVRSFEFKTSGGYKLGNWPARGLKSGNGESEGTLMIDRRALWSTVRRLVPDKDIRAGVTVESVTIDGKVKFDGGEVLEGDIIIGADGVKSVVRPVVVDEGEQGRDPQFQRVLTPSKLDLVSHSKWLMSPIIRLLMNLGGYFPAPYITGQSSSATECVMTFGSTGFFGYTPCTTHPSTSTSISALTSPSNSRRPTINSARPGPRAMWWSTFTADPKEVDRKTISSPDDPSLVEGLKARHGRWSDPVIRHIVNDLTSCTVSGDTSASESSAGAKANLKLSTPTWTLPKLPRWYRGKVILIGDAAHALPSTSGQGVSQAFEDSLSISLMLEGVVQNSQGTETSTDQGIILDQDSLRTAAEEWQSQRKPRVEKILDQALRSQNRKRNLNPLDLVVMNVILWLLTKIMGEKSMSWIYDYDYEQELAEQHTMEGILHDLSHEG